MSWKSRLSSVLLRSLLHVTAFSGVAMAATPTPIVSSGVTSYAVNREPGGLFGDPATFWYTRCFDNAPSVITRGTTYRTTPREVLRIDPCAGHLVISNIAVDANYIYFVDNRGPSGHWALQRRSREANATDPATPLVDLGTNLAFAEINAEYPTVLFAILYRNGQNDVMVEYTKDTGVVLAPVVDSGPPNSMSRMQYDGRYLYWLKSGSIIANDTTNGFQSLVATGVSTYVAFGYNPPMCGPGECTDAVAYVYYGKGFQIFLTDAISGGQFPQYTSASANASITDLVVDNVSRLYWFERRPAVPGGVFDREDRLFRLGSSLALIFGPVNNGGPGFENLNNDLQYLYFRDRKNDQLLRIPADAAAIPIQSLRATGIEVTQGIQNPNNDVSLLQGRRTFARLYAKTNGASDVPAVAAVLDGFGTNGFYLGRIEPVNAVGKLLTLKNKPKRMNIDESFLFELPIWWTFQSTLSFSGTVNPLAAQIEDNFGDNTFSSPILPMSQSARLPLQVIEFWYNRNGVLVTGGSDEVFNMKSWIQRLYPLAEGGSLSDPGPGLHFNSRTIIDDGVASRADRSSKDCDGLKPADKNQCAGNYVVARVRAMRAAGDLPKDRHYHAAIAQIPLASGARDPAFFTRGFTPDNETISCGPKHDENYMAHEVGHQLLRLHPSTGRAPVCPSQDDNPDDTNYPYPSARIGGDNTAATDETALAGFDPGRNGAATKQVLGASTRGDTMSYCSPYWISDHNYAGLDARMSFFPIGGAGLPHVGAAGAPQAAALPGDWLLAFGSLSLSTGTGSFSEVRRTDSVADAPALVNGGFTLELRSASSGLLASHPFTPEKVGDVGPDLRSFGLVVPFVTGTRSLRITQASPPRVLATHNVSANPPSLSNVSVTGAQPLSGSFTVGWTASDPDGDSLQFDVFQTRDGGTTWRPLRLSVVGSSVQLDSALLGGGTSRLRVVARDGAQSARAESANFLVAARPPVVTITNPPTSPVLHLQWSQVVNFLADIEDPQEQPILAANVVWSNAYRTLGTGRALAVTDLEVGTNVVSLQVTNAAGLTTTRQVTVAVGDALALPGPRLAASPSPVAWQVAGNATALQSTGVAVSNVGGGQLRFSAATDRPWLQVNGSASIASASAPVTLVVSGNPSGLPDATVSAGQVTLSNLDDPADSLVIPVTLAKGDLVGGLGFVDTDGDGVADDVDDCVQVADANQRDTDNDGFGNVCDADLNNDGIVNFTDLARLKAVFLTTDANGDLNGDGVVNFTDLARLKALFLRPPGPSGKG